VFNDILVLALLWYCVYASLTGVHITHTGLKAAANYVPQFSSFHADKKRFESECLLVGLPGELVLAPARPAVRLSGCLVRESVYVSVRQRAWDNLQQLRSPTGSQSAAAQGKRKWRARANVLYIQKSTHIHSHTHTHTHTQNMKEYGVCVR